MRPSTPRRPGSPSSAIPLATSQRRFLIATKYHLLPFHVSFGTNVFLDKLTITPDQFYALLETEAEPPRSSQPSAAGIEALFSFLGSHYDSIVVLTISEKMSGMYSACRVASEKNPELKISVVNSKGLSAQIGLIALTTAEASPGGEELRRRH